MSVAGSNKCQPIVLPEIQMSGICFLFVDDKDIQDMEVQATNQSVELQVDFGRVSVGINGLHRRKGLQVLSGSAFCRLGQVWSTSYEEL
jgi:hypothetical protein